MKNFSVVLFVFLIPALLFAQEETLKGIYKDVTKAINTALLTQKGVLEISGFASYNYEKTEYTYGAQATDNFLHVEPGISYFVADNIALGLNLAYTYQKYKFTSSKTMSTSQIYVGPLAKMYFGKDRFRPFIMADYLFLTGDQFDGGEADLGGGLLYHLDGNIGLNLFIKYGIIWYDSETLDNKNRIFVGLGISGFIL
jgi:hypothetical protein